MERDRWVDLLSRVCIKSENVTYDRILAAYSQSHRAYHTVKHVDACLAQLDACPIRLDNRDSVELAIWFHDVIYQPYSKKNEEKSAAFAANFLESNGADSELITCVTQLILVTQHSIETTSDDESILVDIDLAVLGSDPEVYDQYEKAIRFEYKYVPRMLFKRSRARILKTFLDREHLFETRFYREKFEVQARANIERTLRYSSN